MRIDDDLRLPMVACDLAARAEPQQHEAALATWRAAVVGTTELADGLAFELAPLEGLFEALTTFIRNERQCCPFFTFGLELPPSGPVFFRMTGPEGAKQLLRDGLPQLH